MMQRDADQVFLNDKEFATTATYTTHNGTPKSVKAIRLQQPPTKPGNTPRAMVNQEEVYVSRSDLSTRPVIDGDTIKFGDEDRKTVRAIKNEHDPAVWHLVIN